jgi:hypothetical protein
MLHMRWSAEAWEPTPWRAVQRAAWEATLLKDTTYQS